LETIADDIAKVTGAVERVLGGDEGKKALQEFVDNINATTRAIRASVAGNQEQFNTIVKDVAAITGEVRRFSGPAGRNINGILSEVAEIVHQVNSVVGASSGDAADSLATLKGTLSKLQASLESLNEATGNIASITRKIDEGSGTLGRLVNDDHLAQEIDTMVEDAGDFVHTLTGMQTQVGLRSEYNFGLNSLKNYISVRFQPREDKYYLLEIIDDPRGSTSVVRRTLESTDPSQHQLTHEQETITTDELKFSLQFAKEYHFLTGRFGIIEGAGGFGGNARLFDDKLDVAADLFDFGTDENPRLRVRLAYEFFRRMYVVGGLDDVVNFRAEQPGEAFFLGASLRFTDNDLKALLTTMPAPSL
jgi:phospholipid/cholesterol/gamma-HCH transport system substrate-binding protein